jgi:hypothetical protein
MRQSVMKLHDELTEFMARLTPAFQSLKKSTESMCERKINALYVVSVCCGLKLQPKLSALQVGKQSGAATQARL